MTVRAIILKYKRILLIHRFKEKKEYYVLPGGHTKDNETNEDALIREIKEETNLDITIEKKLFKLEEDTFFLVTKFSGKLKLGKPEIERQTKENRYILEWHDKEEIFDLIIYPKGIKKKLKVILNPIQT